MNGSWSYSGNPAASDRDEVRFLVGDTDPDSKLLSNEEIDFLLVQYPKVTSQINYTAALAACETIIGVCAKKMTKSVGGLSLQWSERFQHYTELAERLKKTMMNPRLSTQRIGPPQLFGGGKTYLGPDDSPSDYFDTSDSDGS